MFRNGRKIVLAALIAVLAAFALVTQVGASGQGQGAYKLEGAWIARVITMNGNPYPYVGQWSYVLAPNPSGKSATMHGSVDVAFPQTIPSDFATPIIGEGVMTGPDTAEFNTIFMAIAKGVPVAHIVFIGRALGHARFVAPDKAEFTTDFEIYLPAQDADGDGLPDPGQTPVRTFTVTTVDTRVPSPVR